MKTEEMSLDSLIPYERNAKKHDETQVSNVAKSIKEFGMVQPIVVDGDNNIIIGHCRALACKRLGIKTVPVVKLEDLSPEDANKLRFLDNKLNESEWDMEMLKLDGLAEIDFDGFDLDIDFSGLGESDDYDIQEDDVPPIPDDPIAKEGDIYQLGEHRLICGDSTDTDIIDRLMDGEKADMVLTDPPYGMYLDTDFSGIKGSMKSIGKKNNTSGNKYDRVIGDNDDFTPDLINTVFTSFGYCKEIFLFGADYFAELLPDKNNGAWMVWDKRKESQADAIGSEFELIWSRAKHKRRMLRHDWFGFLSSENSADARHRVHPTQKPITLLVDIIDQWGKDAKAIVDLYGGSGSTLIACEQTGRKCYMCELDPHYVDVIIERWENLTGKKAVKL